MPVAAQFRQMSRWKALDPETLKEAFSIDKFFRPTIVWRERERKDWLVNVGEFIDWLMYENWLIEHVGDLIDWFIDVGE